MLNLLSKNKNYCVFDIGMDKIACLLFQVENKKSIIAGMDYQKSTGVNNNSVKDDAKLSETISKALRNTIPRKLNIKNINFFCNITDTKLITKKNYCSLDSNKFSLTKKDIRRIFKKSILDSKVKGKQLIHSYPLNFRIDENRVVSDPVGEKCKKFGMSSFNIMVNQKYLNQLDRCFKGHRINIKSFFDTGIASSVANISKIEKKNGVACIDIGHSTSKLTVFINDNIVYCNVLPIGGFHVTNDIAKGLDVSLEFAEHTKLVHGTLAPPFDEKFTINSNQIKRKVISKNLLYGIMRPRYEEILEIIRDYIFDDIYARVSIKSIVITGGASKVFGISNLSERIFNRKIRIGNISDKKSFFYNKPEFSTLIGLMRLSQDEKSYKYTNELAKNNLFNTFDKLENWIEESYA
ncbi:MAG: cell division protein FtsA [Alphaproteobacteria bacterium]|tara:strand:+ start:733 stop:1956 length:1224 start_codon:yes stop_codon:yes gene_type:complete